MARYVEELPTLKEPEKPPSARPVEDAPISAPEAPPRTLGRYTLLFEIARGGMGSVHAAVLRGESGVERAVAIKLLHGEGRGAEEIDAFVREAKVTSHIAHPNVLPTFELGMRDGEPFIVMPLVRGVTLAKLMHHLSSGGDRMRPALSAWIAMKVAAALHAAHELVGPDGAPLHVVHRDVSPQNVMLAFDGEVLLVDFGIAKLFESSRATASGVIKGKFGYMSPEQLLGEPLDRRTDIFALGVVLYEMLTGRPLYSDLAPAVAALRITNEAPPSLAEVASDVPASLQRIVDRAMGRHREDRYPNAKELESDLRALLRDGEGADEAELVRLLEERFGDVREAFERKLREALARPRGATGGEGASSVAPSASTHAGKAPAAPRRVGMRAALIVGIAAALVGVGGSLLFALGRQPPRAASGPIGSATGTQARPARVEAEAPSLPFPTLSDASGSVSATVSSSSPSASALGSPSASSAKPSAARIARPVPPDSAKTGAAAPSAAPSPPPSASVKGEPFRRW